MQQAWILRFGELGLKSRVVRRQFQRALSNNMESLAENANISLIKDRIKSMEVVTSDSKKENVDDLLSHVLGVIAVDPAKVISESINPNLVAKAILEDDSRAVLPKGSSHLDGTTAISDLLKNFKTSL